MKYNTEEEIEKEDLILKNKIEDLAIEIEEYERERALFLLSRGGTVGSPRHCLFNWSDYFRATLARIFRKMSIRLT